MNHFNYGIIIGAIESAPLLGAYLFYSRVPAMEHLQIKSDSERLIIMLYQKSTTEAVLFT